MVSTWQLGDEVVTLGSRRSGVVVGIDDALKVRVKFEDDQEMNVLRARLASPRFFPLANFRTFIQKNEIKEGRQGLLPCLANLADLIYDSQARRLRALLELIDLTEKLRKAGVDLEDVAQFFEDSERNTAFNLLDVIFSVDVLQVGTQDTGSEVITEESARPYTCACLTEKQISAACDCVRFWGSMGWAGENRNSAQYPYSSISHSVLTGKPPDLHARMKDARFACRIASSFVRTYGDKWSKGERESLKCLTSPDPKTAAACRKRHA